MSSKSIKPLAGLLGAALLSGAASHASAATLNPFVADELQSGYNLPNFDKHEGEGKCGEGKCGDGKASTEGKCGEGKASTEGKCGEGKAHAEGTCGEAKSEAEGKCGEGKCGAGKSAHDDSPDTE